MQFAAPANLKALVLYPDGTARAFDDDPAGPGEAGAIATGAVAFPLPH